ncbi:MAG: penicillin-binding protein 2 [Acidimicrobiales bacterium]
MSYLRPNRRFEQRRRGARPQKGAANIDLIGHRPLPTPPTYAPPALPPSETGAPRQKRTSRPYLRITIAAVAILAMFAALVVRLYSLQVLNSKKLSSAAQQITTRKVILPAARGSIFARGGQPLAKDDFEWVVTLQATPGPTGRIADPTVEHRLVVLLGLSMSDIRADLASNQYSPYQPIPVAFNVAPSIVLSIDAHRQEFPGVSAIEEPVRSYPYDDLATQTLGYVRPITESELNRLARYGYTSSSIVGQSGVEAQYERYLQGTSAVITEEVDPSGTVVRTVSQTSGRPGDSVVLNLSVPLQQVVSNDLANEITYLHSQGLAAPLGAAVVLDPRNGAVLAMTSDPSYNDNWWVTGMTNARYGELTNNNGYPLNNWAVQGFQPPGSTFKIATATAALQSGLISPYSEIDDTGIFTLPGGTVLHDADNAPLGWVDVSTALTASSDFFFYTLGERFWYARSTYGMTPIQNMAHLYGFGTKDGIDLPQNEVQNGWVDSPQVRAALHRQAPSVYANSWYLGDNVEMAFGQGESVVTPLAEATAYSTLANGGTRYAPELAAGVVSSSGKLVKRIHPKVMDRIHYSPSTYQALMTGFEGAVQSSNGTAYNDFIGFNFSKWNLAGKTGTATVTVNDVKQPTSWFVAFGGPRGEAPKYAVCVEINQAGYGASAAAPVVREIFNYLYAHGLGKLKLHA